MASLLQQGITAFEKGDTASARKLFEQVLQADDENDRALVWLSRVSPPEEKLQLLQRALSLNPANAEAQAALDDLLHAPDSPDASEQGSSGLLKNTRKPFRLADDETPAAPEYESPPSGDNFAELRNASQPVVIRRKTRNRNTEMLPLILIGALSVMAVGGVILLILVMALT